MTAAVPAIAAPTAAPVETHLTPQEVAALLTRGDVLLGNGDIVSARLCYQRAAEGGNAQAALRLGESYDPGFLVQTQLNGVRGDRNAAARWYQRAIELGANEADTLLKSLGKP
jgi:TPR repeat protein